MASLRMFKKAILLILITATCSTIILMNTASSNLKLMVISKYDVQNVSTHRPFAPIRVVKSFDLFKLPKGVINMLAPGGADNPKIDTISFTLDDTTTTESFLQMNMTNSGILKKTLYPVTLYAPYLMENPKLCASVPDLSMLVIVHTAPAHLERRSFIRKTWTNETYFLHLGRVRVLFLLGRVNDPKVQNDIEKEFTRYGDLLQGDFIDAYRNLSHKGVMAYKWISERCKNAKLILKVDDDVAVNTYEMLIKYVPLYGNRTKRIFCNHIYPGTMPIIRQNTSKWYVDENLFKGQKFYPQYCSGFTVVFTNDFMPALHRAAAVTPFFWVDDVYLYGMVPGKVPGIKYDGFPPNSVMLVGQQAISCYKNVTRTCDYLIVGARDNKEKDDVWTYMTKQYEAKMMKNSHATHLVKIKATQSSALLKDNKAAQNAPVGQDNKAAQNAPVAQDNKAAQNAPLGQDNKAAEMVPVGQDNKATQDAPLGQDDKTVQNAPLGQENKVSQSVPLGQVGQIKIINA